jgi:hypothetical protein
MAHWAELDENNIVLRVSVGDNNDPNGDEGYQWLIDNLGGRWVKTSYNATIRRKYAGEGDYFDEELDGFIPPQPYPSWLFDTETWTWNAPTSKPKGTCIWKESTLEWVQAPDSGMWSWNFEIEEWTEI